jgi:autotransporter-associated beta strand protein
MSARRCSDFKTVFPFFSMQTLKMLCVRGMIAGLARFVILLATMSFSAAALAQTTVFSENFNGITNLSLNGNQYLTSWPVGFGGNLPGWTKWYNGNGAFHGVNLNPSGDPNWALMLFEGSGTADMNALTSAPVPGGNVLGVNYSVTFDLGPAVYQDSSQATTATDAVGIKVLSGSNYGTMLAQQTFNPGSFASQAGLYNLPFHTVTVNYTGTGQGNPELFVYCATAGSGRFAGAVDNLKVQTVGGLAPLTWVGSVNGSWNTSDANWINGSNSATYVDGSPVLFDDSVGIGSTNISITGSVAPSLVTFNNSYVNYNLQTSSGSGITGATCLTMSGSAILTMSGTNTYSGGTNITAGTLAVASVAPTLGSGPIGIYGGTLQYLPGAAAETIANSIVLAGTSGRIASSGNTVTIPNPIVGGGGLGLSGGSFSLTASNTYSGNTTVNSGTLSLAGGGQLYVGASNATAILLVNSGAILTTDRWDTSFGSLSFSPGQFVLNGGTVSYTGATNAHATNTDGRGFTIGANGATLVTAASGQTWFINADNRGSYGITSTSGGLLTLMGDGNGELDKAVPGSGGLSKSGNGKWILAANNTYTGPTTINGGTLQIGIGGNAGTIAGASSIANDGSLVFSRSDNYGGAWANTISGSGSLRVTGGSLVLNGSSSYTGSTALSAGKLYINGSNATSSITIAAGTTFGGSGSATSAVATISDGARLEPGFSSSGGIALGGLVFTGGGTVAVGFPANYTSIPAISAGTLSTSASPLLISVGTLGVPYTASAGTAHIVQYSGTIGGSGFGSFNVTAPVTSARTSMNLVNNAGAVDLVYRIDYPYWAGAGNGSWDASSTANWNTATNDAPTLFLPGDTVMFDDRAGGAATVTISSGNVSPSLVQFSNTASSYVLQGANGISGSTSVAIKGGGSVTISNSNSYTGGTILSSGLLNIGNAGALGSGTVTIAGGTLGTASGGTTTLSSGGTELWAGNFAYVGPGALNLAGGSINLGVTPTINVSAGSLAVGVTISGTGTLGIVKSGSGLLSFAASNSYKGNTAISGGTLALLGSGQIYVGASNASAVIGVNSGATLVTDRWDTSFGSLNFAPARFSINGGTVAYTGATNPHAINTDGRGFTVGVNGAALVAATPGQTWYINQDTRGSFGLASSSTGSLTLAGDGNGELDKSLPGNGGLIKSGNGLWALAATNSYVGPTIISGGTLQIVNSGTISAASSITDNANLVFSRSDSYGGVFGNAIGGNGNVRLSSGTLVLSASNSYTGATSVNAGSLYLNGQNSTTSIAIAGGTTLGGSGSATAATVTVADGGRIESGYGGSGGLALGGLVFAGSGSLAIGTAAMSLGTLATSPSPVAVTVPLGTVVAPYVTGSGTTAIIQYSGSIGGSGFGSFQLTSPVGTGRNSYTLVSNAGTIGVAYAVDYPYWAGTGNGSWDTSSTGNWKTASNDASTVFFAGDQVLFDDRAGTASTVNISAADVAPSSVLFNNNTSSFVLQGTNGITGSANVSISGGGCVTIANSNSYIGGTSLTSGWLNINNAAALGSGRLTITSGTLGNTSGADITMTSLGSQVWNGSFTFAGPKSLNLGNGPVTFAAPATIEVDAGVLTVGGPISGGTVGLIKTGSGMLSLGGSNTWNGNLTINGGTLALLGGGLVYGRTDDQTDVISVNSGTTLLVDRWDGGQKSPYYPNPDPVQWGTGSFGDLYFTPTQLVIDGGTIVYTGSTNVHVSNLDGRGFTIGANGATLMAASSGQTWYINYDNRYNTTSSGSYGIISNLGGMLTLNGVGNGEMDKNIPGFGGVTIAGPGMWTFAASNPYSGSTTISGGTLQLGTGTAGQDGSLTATSGVTDNASLVYNIAGSQTASYNITGSGSLTKTGSGIVLLAGANDYTGGTVVKNGVLRLGSASAVGNGAVAVNGGTLDLYGAAISVPRFSGTAGVVADSATGSLSVLTINQSSATTFGGSIKDGLGQVGMVLQGSSTLTLSGTNTYSGGTTVADNSRLIVTSAAGLPDGSNLMVGSAFAAAIVPSAPVGLQSEATAVPEPGTFVLLAVVLCCAAACRRLSRSTPIDKTN